MFKNMADKLGYTFYPKDFISDPSVMMMTPSQRGVYRDLIDLAYMNDNCIPYTTEQLSKYTNADPQEVEEVLKMKGEKRGNFWAIPSCDKRIGKANVNRENGAKGGRPTKPKNNPNQNPTINPNETQNERQREREVEREIEKKVNEIDMRKLKFADTLKPFVSVYGKDMIFDFYCYWTEPNKSNTKFKQELQKTWDTKRRLQTWCDNDSKFGNKNKSKGKEPRHEYTYNFDAGGTEKNKFTESEHLAYLEKYKNAKLVYKSKSEVESD